MDITNDNAKYLKTLFKTIAVLIPPIVDDRPKRAERLQRSPYALQLNETCSNMIYKGVEWTKKQKTSLV